MDSIPIHLLESFSIRLQEQQSKIGEKRDQTVEATNDFAQALQKSYPAEVSAEVTEELYLLGLPLNIRKKMLEKLSYQELAKMDETCSDIHEEIINNRIKGIIEMYEFKFIPERIEIGINFYKLCSYSLQQVLAETNARIKVEKLVIEETLTDAMIECLSSVLVANGIPIKEVEIRCVQGHGLLRIPPPILENPLFFQLLPKIRAQEISCSFDMLEEDLVRPEVQQLERLYLWGNVQPELSKSTIERMMNPLIVIGRKLISADSLKSLLNQWQQGSRNIRYFSITGRFEMQEVLEDSQAEALWTYYQNDMRILKFFPLGRGSRSKFNIMLMKRGPEKEANDFLILFFTSISFFAATLDGIIDEKLWDKFSLVT